MLDLGCCGGFSLVAINGLLIAVTSYCGTQAVGHIQSSAVVAQVLQHSSIVVVHRLSCFIACVIFLDQGCLLYWQASSYH